MNLVLVEHADGVATDVSLQAVALAGELGGETHALLIGLCSDVAHGLLARIPAFVWRDLQVAPPAFHA